MFVDASICLKRADWSFALGFVWLGWRANMLLMSTSSGSSAEGSRRWDLFWAGIWGVGLADGEGVRESSDDWSTFVFRS